MTRDGVSLALGGIDWYQCSHRPGASRNDRGGEERRSISLGAFGHAVGLATSV